MAYPIPGSITLSSSGTSTQIPLDPTARTTTILFTGTSNVTSSSTAATTAPAPFQIQLTFDTWLPAAGLSSAGSSQIWQNASSIVYTSTQPDGAFLSILGPIAGCRLFSSGNSSAAWSGTVTLKALQSLTAGP